MRRILITIDGGPGSRDSLRTAAMLCAMTGASLSVAHATGDMGGVSGLGESLVVVNAVEEGRVRARAAFDEICAGVPEGRFKAYTTTSVALVAVQGPAHDLILLERISREEGPKAQLLNAALFETGRPVMLLPPEPRTAPIRRPALAWNGTAISARAIRSALPLLQPAGRATLLIGSGAGNIRPDPLREYLASYGVATEVHAYDSDHLTARARGRALIAAAVASGADLLVTGAFGESAAGSIFGLGRATQKLATAAPMPVLMQN
jgi:nucleotide-binding universal stress UspA family protein